MNVCLVVFSFFDRASHELAASVHVQSSQRGCTCKSTEMYTDHINVTFSAGTIPDLESQINIDLKYIDRWVKAYKLSLNVARTEFMVITSSHKLQYLNAYTMNIYIDGGPIIQSNQSQSLGLMIDENLSWKAHIHGISRKVSSGIGSLKRVRSFVSMHTAIKIYKGLIAPHFEYCTAVWDGFTQQLSEKLQKLQNRAIRVFSRGGWTQLEKLHGWSH